MFDSIDFKPEQKGLSKVLGTLEAEVMEAIWEKEECSVREIYEHLRSKRKIAYTTVMTIMTRLAEKELLLKEKQGPAFIYRPALTREQFNQKVTSKVITGLLDGFGKGVLAQLIEETGKASPEALEELEKLIAQRRKP